MAEEKWPRDCRAMVTFALRYSFNGLPYKFEMVSEFIQRNISKFTVNDLREMATEIREAACYSLTGQKRYIEFADYLLEKLWEEENKGKKQNGTIKVRLTKDVLDSLFAKQNTIRVRRGNITLELGRDCTDAALDCLGDMARIMEWELLG